MIVESCKPQSITSCVGLALNHVCLIVVTLMTQKPNKATLVRVQRILALLNLLPQLQNTGFSVFQRLSSFLGVGMQCPRFSLMSRPRQERASLQAGEDRLWLLIIV